MISGRASLVVHHYEPAPSRKGKEASISSEELLSRGRSLVSVTESTDGWRTVKSPSAALPRAGQKLVLRRPPPSHISLRSETGDLRPVEKLEEWGSTPDRKKTEHISQLKEFEGTDFSYLPGRKRQPRDHPAGTGSTNYQKEKRKGKPSREASEEVYEIDEQRSKKRRRVDNTTASLYNLIPHPHHHPHSPVNQRPDMDVTERFPPFSKAPLVPAAPFNQGKLDCYLKDPYARSAWIIPVNGKLPWQGATSGRLVNNISLVGSQKSRIPTAPSSINWTPFVINKFWTDLLEIRKQATLGSISVSFRVASAAQLQFNVATATNTTARTITKKSADQSRHQLDTDKPGSIEQCTYIKVYHDARYAMYMRSVLDAWRTEVEVQATSVASRVTSSPRKNRAVSRPATTPHDRIKIRPLQGVTLTLVDETGQMIGIC